MGNLAALESSQPEGVIMSLIYIADFCPSDLMRVNKNYGSYFNTMNRGRLTIFNDKCCQWTINIRFIVFFTVEDFS